MAVVAAMGNSQASAIGACTLASGIQGTGFNKGRHGLGEGALAP